MPRASTEAQDSQTSGVVGVCKISSKADADLRRTVRSSSVKPTHVSAERREVRGTGTGFLVSMF
jgi:hypothetical protein